MVFSSTTNKNGIIQNCESNCSLGDGGISGNATLLLKFTGWINDAYAKIATAILQSDKNWRWDDSNWGANSNQAVPVGTVTLVDSQRDYNLPRATNSSDPSTLWKVYKVRLQDTSGEWYDLTPLGSGDSETSNSSGQPNKYRLLGNVIRLSDPPTSTGVTLTSGMQIWFQREFDKFVSTDTTQQPGFISAYHYLLALDASATFLLPTNINQATSYMTLFRAGLEDIKNSYAQRNDDPNTTKRMSPAREGTR